LGTNLCPHMHFVIPTDGAGIAVENVKFSLTYSWANLDGEFPAETTISGTVDVQAKLNDTHFILELETPNAILESNAAGTDNVSGMLLCSLERDTAVATNYDDVIYLLEVDFHYEKDTLGSRTEYAK